MARIIRTAPLIPATGFEPADVRLGSEGEVSKRPEADVALSASGEITLHVERIVPEKSLCSVAPPTASGIALIKRSDYGMGESKAEQHHRIDAYCKHERNQQSGEHAMSRTHARRTPGSRIQLKKQQLAGDAAVH